MTTSAETFGNVITNIGDNVTTYWTGLTNAISASSSFISGGVTASAAQYEAIGRQMADLASNYTNGLTTLAEGTGTTAERAMLADKLETLS